MSQDPRPSASDPTPESAGAEQRPSGSPARALAVAVGLAIAGPALGLVLVLVAGNVLALAGVEITPILNVAVSLVFLTWGGIGGVALLFLRYRGEDLSYLGVRLPTPRDLLVTVVGYVAALGAGLSAAVLVSVLDIQTGTNNAAAIGMENPEVLLLLIPAAFIFIGVGEELLFRGVVQSRLREAFSPAMGIFLASVIFAAIHYAAVTGPPAARLASISLLVFPSVVFGVVYEYTDNLVIPVFLHGAYDATLFSLLYVAVTYGDISQQASVLLT